MTPSSVRLIGVLIVLSPMQFTSLQEAAGF